MCLQLNQWQRVLATAIVVSAMLMLFLEVLSLFAGVPFTWSSMFVRWLFVILTLALARFGEPYSIGEFKWVLPRAGIAVLVVGAIAWVPYYIIELTSIAWVAFTAFFIGLVWLSRVTANGRSRFKRWAIHALLALLAGTALVLMLEIEAHFADEEFFVLVQGLALAGFGWLLSFAYGFFAGTQIVQRRGLRFDSRWVVAVVIALAIASIAPAVHAYQSSFNPTMAPKYHGITAETPFSCGQAGQAKETFEGSDVFRRILARVQANPQKAAPEYGMLGLGTGEQRWADAFRTSILDEAARQLFIGPANSLKSIQYEAALRVYYFSKVHVAFPSLFSFDEEKFLRQWFASINRRALTVEWVDWMYALAFAKFPEGPYENQENGAGLLAVLESNGLAAPDLSTINRMYLERNQRGWTARFRNTDDAFVYQPEWITNAYFQSLFANQSSLENERLAFEWMLLQASPGGGAPSYNHPSTVSLAGIAYLGARLLGDERYVWLSGKALDIDEAHGKYSFAQPGVEQAVNISGKSPTQGSCLLYGDSGLPNQIGPLAPDKIVFRDGWSNDDMYLLLNLRFTGWHRYKATNSVILTYQDGPLAREESEGTPFSWLPSGRSLFRDKRVPRENMNGLLIERKGLSEVLYELTGAGGPWAQDPPYYVTVDRFETGTDKDVSVTTLDNWHGWRNTRAVYFFHGGPVVVVDEARGPVQDKAALVWHLKSDNQIKDGRIGLRAGVHPAEAIFLSLGQGETQSSKPNDSQLLDVIYRPVANGKLGLVTLFLTREWFGADAGLVRTSEGLSLRITHGDKHIDLALQLSSND